MFFREKDFKSYLPFNNKIERTFIVGVARSGTTLLQSMVGNHDDIATFPETHFFRKTIDQNWKRKNNFKIKREDQKFIKNFLIGINKEEIYEKYKGDKLNVNSWGSYLIKILDQIAIDDGKNHWLEKTPMHLRYIELISGIQQHNNMKFIHMIRNPLENIAALYDVSKQYPESFQQNNIDAAISRYIFDLKISENCRKLKNHHIVYYEDLVSDPNKTLEEICSFLNLDYNPNMLQFQKNADKITAKNEDWKASNTKKLKKTEKAEMRLNSDQMSKINNEISSLDLFVLQKYKL